MKNEYLISERQFLQKYLVMFRKLCYLNGEKFGLKIAGITKQSISKYESQERAETQKEGKKADINIMLYIAIRQFLDYECQNKQDRKTLREMLRLFDSYFVVSREEQNEIKGQFDYLIELLESDAERGEERTDEDWVSFFGIGKDDREVGKIGIPEYKYGEWYNQYQEEIQYTVEEIEKNVALKEKEKKIFRKFLKMGCSTEEIAQDCDYPVKYVEKLIREIQTEDEKKSRWDVKYAEAEKAMEELFSGE